MPNVQKLNAIKNAVNNNDQKRLIEDYLNEEKNIEPLIQDTLNYWKSLKEIEKDDIRHFVFLVSEIENLTNIAKQDLRKAQLTKEYFGSTERQDPTLSNEEVLKIQLSVSYIKNLKASKSAYERKYESLSKLQISDENLHSEEIDPQMIFSLQESIKDPSTKNFAKQYIEKYLTENFQNNLSIEKEIEKEEKQLAKLKMEIEEKYIPEVTESIIPFEKELLEIKNKIKETEKKLEILKLEEEKVKSLTIIQDDDYAAIIIKLNELSDRISKNKEFKSQFDHIKQHPGFMSSKANTLLLTILDGYDFEKTILFRQSDIISYLAKQKEMVENLKLNRPQQVKQWDKQLDNLGHQIKAQEKLQKDDLELETKAKKNLAQAEERLKLLKESIQERFTKGNKHLENSLLQSMEVSGHSTVKKPPQATQTSVRSIPAWIALTREYLNVIQVNIKHFTDKKIAADAKSNTKRSERYAKAIASFKGLQQFGIYCCRDDKDFNHYESNKAQLLQYAEIAQKDLDESRALKKGGILGFKGLRAQFQTKGKIKNELDGFVSSLKKL